MKHIPEAALEQHTAVLGKTGSGKTSTTKLIVEYVVSQGARVCILDPLKSDWWGITSSRDGKKPGLPFKILGGPHGHVPLHPDAGAAIGELIANGKLPLSIIDMADFGPGGLSRFYVEFAPVLFRHNTGVVYLVMEEAHEFAPKERSGIGAENMAIYWSKKLATGSRSKGIRLIAATQATQYLHNAILGSCDTMIAHRLTLPAQQKPVVDWLKNNVDKETLEEVSGSLAGLPTGTGWVCSGEAQFHKKVKFPRITTYDNTVTPTQDTDHSAVTTASVDADELKEIIGDAVKEAEANDPKALKTRIAELEDEVRRVSDQCDSVQKPDPAVLEHARQEGYQEGWGTAKTEFADRVMPVIEDAVTGLSDSLGRLNDLSELIGAVKGVPSAQRPAEPPVQTAPKPVVSAVRAAPAPSTATSDGTLSKAAVELLSVACQRHPIRFSWSQLAALSKRKARGGSFNTAKKEILEGGYACEEGALVVPFDKAFGQLGISPAEAPANRDDLVVMWASALPSPADALLRGIVEWAPITKDLLAERLGRQPRGGSWNGAVKILRDNQLIRESGQTLEIGEALSLQH